MWQNIIVIIIVLIAAYYVGRQLWASVAGRGGCDADQCGGCPYADGCDEPPPPRRKKKGGCGCGCQ